MDTKTMQCMWILNTNDAWKKFGQILKNWIESGRFKPKFLIAILINRETASIDWKSGKVNFWKTKQVNAETPQSTLFYE